MVCRYGIYHAGWLPGEKSSSCAAIVVKRELWRVFKCVGPKWPQNAILDHIPPVSLSSLLRNPVPEIPTMFWGVKFRGLKNVCPFCTDRGYRYTRTQVQVKLYL